MGNLMNERKKRKPLFITVIVLVSIVGALLLTVGSYLIYVIADYSRVGDIVLEVNNNQTARINESDIGTKEFSISSYNIGFGAYEREYSFFMDTSIFKDDYVESQGKKENTGAKSHAFSKENVLKNTNGAYDTMIKQGDLDFLLYQEVDTSSTRSFKVNQYEIGNEKHANYGNLFGINYHSSYLMYPFHEPIGKSNSGISTYSKYNVASAKRYEFKITDSFFGKFFDLDRAFTIAEFSITSSEKKLFVINVHMSAYDENGVVRKVQLQQLKEVYKEVRDIDGKDNYVIIGGDFNHDLLIDDPRPEAGPYRANFNQQETDGIIMDWYNYLRLDPSKHGETVTNAMGVEELYNYDFHETDIIPAGPTNLPTCRDASIPFADANNNGIIDNFMVTIDGFLVSSNIEVTNVETIGSGEGLQVEPLLVDDGLIYGKGFVYSDHNPVVMNFKLAA